MGVTSDGDQIRRRSNVHRIMLFATLNRGVERTGGRKAKFDSVIELDHE